MIFEVIKLSSLQSLDDYKKSSINEIKKLNKPAEILDEEITLAGKAGISIVYTVTKEDKRIKKMEVFTLKNSKVYLITYEAEADKYEQFFDTAKTMINSLQIE